MQVLPSGLVVPPLPYAAALGVAAVAVVAALWRLRPPVTTRVVLAATPWMVLGGGLHALLQYGLVPPPVAPLLTAPAVYLTTTVLAGAVWTVAAVGGTTPGTADSSSYADTSAGVSGADHARGSTLDPTRTLGVVGAIGLLALAAVAYADALGRVETLTLAWPLVGVAGAAAVAGPVYYALRARRPAAVERVGVAGVVVVFAHALDGVSTAIGVDLLDTGERSPIPREIMAFAGELPTAPFLGSGWLFVVVKLAVAAVVVVLLADYVEAEPAEGVLLLTLVAAVGMGPAANNLVLFLLSGG